MFTRACLLFLNHCVICKLKPHLSIKLKKKTKNERFGRTMPLMPPLRHATACMDSECLDNEMSSFWALEVIPLKVSSTIF